MPTRYNPHTNLPEDLPGANPAETAMARPNWDPNAINRGNEYGQGSSLDAWMNQQGPDYQIPNGWSRDPSGNISRDASHPGILDKYPWLIPVAGIGAGVGLAATGIGGATAALGPSTAESMAATQAATTAPASLAAGGGSSLASGAGGILKGLIPDSKTLILSLLSLMGNGGAQRESFRDPGQMTDPKQALQQSLNGIYRLGQGVSEMGPVKLRSSYVQGPPSPVTIPGLPFQIGGGMGRDPALDNPALLEAGGGNPFKYDPFQSLSAAGANGNPNPSIPGAKRRTP